MNRYRSYYYFAISIALTICMTYLRCFFFIKGARSKVIHNIRVEFSVYICVCFLVVSCAND